MRENDPISYRRAPTERRSFRRRIMKCLVAAATLATLVVSPALAQSYDPSVGSGNLNSVPYQAAPPAQGSTPHDAHAQIPQLGNGHRAPVQAPHTGTPHRSPYGQYDAHGNLIDENMPGRW
jgi:hypothetical protein